MFKQLMGYIGEYRRYFILAPILVVGESLTELILPYLMGKLVSNGVGTSNLPVRWGAKPQMHLITMKKETKYLLKIIERYLQRKLIIK